MNDATAENQRHFLDRISNALKKGGALTDTVINYIDATLFPPESDRLTAFLKGAAESERDSLLDLIFFPNQAVQIDLEPLLEAARYSADDEEEIHGRLIDRRVDARITLPDGSQLANIQVPEWIKSQYLERLNITWQLDRQVAAAIQSGVSSKLGCMVKVRLRNAGIRFAVSQRVFLCRFFERMVDSDPDFLACLDLVLSILGRKKRGGDVYDLLVEHKRSLFRSLQQAKRFEILLRQANMETLMLQGVRPVHVSRDDQLREMRLIDQVCYAVFGKTEAIAPPKEEPVCEVTDLENPEAALKSLLR